MPDKVSIMHMACMYWWQKRILLTVPRRYFFCGSFPFLCLVFLMLSRLFLAALWSPAGKGLTYWLLLVMFIVRSGVVLDCIVS